MYETVIARSEREFSAVLLVVAIPMIVFDAVSTGPPETPLLPASESVRVIRSLYGAVKLLTFF